MLQNFIRASQDFLVRSFNISESDAISLAIFGVNDILQGPSVEQFLVDTYGTNYSQIQNVYDKFTKGTGGTKCN